MRAFLLFSVCTSAFANGHGVQQGGGGYGAPAQQEYAHAQEEYHEPEPEPICLKVCPLDFPMLNPRTGVCSARPEEPEEPAYHQEGAYHHQEAYHQQEYHQQEYRPQSQYRKLQQAYGGASAQQEYEPEEPYEPDELIDTTCGAISRSGRIALWIAFAILFLSALFFFRMFHFFCTIGECCEELHDGECYTSIYHFLSPVAVYEGAICLIASLAYLCMATGNGFYVQCSGRIFFYVRYIDWLITTPLILSTLIYFANGSDELFVFLIFLDAIMILAGLVAATIDGPAMWGFFALAVLAFIPILYYLCQLRCQTCDNRQYWAECGLLVDEADYGKDGTCYLPHLWFFHTFKKAVNLVVIAWFLYPIIWICADGTGVLCVDGETIAYAVLDIITKAVFGFLVVCSKPCCKSECKKNCKLMMDFYDDKE